jgi:ATP-dependent helicase HrpB
MIWVIQPRRLAARSLAHWVAKGIGEEPGGLVGYQVRFDRKVSDRTRVVFLTPGVALRLWDDPRIRPSISVVLLDEFHERGAEADALGALVLKERIGGTGPALWILSATIDTEPWSRWLSSAGPVDVLESQGRLHPVAISHHPPAAGTPLPESVARAVRELLRRGPEGDILCFVPGIGEIRRTIDLLASLRHPSLSLRLLPLHGDLEPQEQDEALRPAPPGTLNIVVATNVAETSLTLPGVRHVVDSGYVRSARYDPRRGLDTLYTVRASLRSADQRAGRAGRVAPGTCWRLWHETDIPPDDELPEIRRVDLAPLWLQLSGRQNPSELPWPSPPEPERVQAARELLERLDAVDASGKRTATGADLAQMPVSVRTARVLLESRRIGGAKAAVAWAVGRESRGGDEDRLRRALADLANPSPAREIPLGRLLLPAFADRIAIRTDASTSLSTSTDRWRLPDGRVAEGDAPGKIGLALEVQETANTKGTTLRLRDLEPIEPEWLEDAFPGRISTHVEIDWDARARRVVGREVARLDGLELWARPVDDNRLPRLQAEETLAKLVASGDIRWKWGEDEDDWVSRTRLVAKAFPERDLCVFSEEDLDLVRSALVEGCLAAPGVENREVLPYLREVQGQEQMNFVERMAPRQTTLASGRKARIAYQPDGSALVSARIGDFVGVKQESIRIAQGRIPMNFEILAPNHRPVQRTADLDGFWQRSYPEIKADLKRRYPRHPWP